MLYKRSLLVCALVAGLPVAVYYLAPGLRARVRGAYSLHANPPIAYTIELEDSLMSKSTEEPSVVDRRVVARRADGAMVFSHELQGGNTPNRHRRLHTSDGLKIIVDDVLGTTTTFREYPAGSMSRELSSLDPGTDCQTTRHGRTSLGEKPAGYEEVLGYRTVKAIAESQGDRWTFWRAPDLGCEIVQQVIEFRRPGEPFKLNSRMVATNVRVGEPAAYLFDVPKGYKEVSVLEHEVEKAKFHAARRSKAFTPEMEKSIRETSSKALRAAEQAYAQRRP